jgi:hypothetical protein
MNELLRDLEVGATEAAKTLYKKYGAVIFHLCALSGYLICSFLAPQAPLQSKIFILIYCFVVGQLAVSFAKKCVKKDEQ